MYLYSSEQNVSLQFRKQSTPAVPREICPCSSENNLPLQFRKKCISIVPSEIYHCSSEVLQVLILSVLCESINTSLVYHFREKTSNARLALIGCPFCFRLFLSGSLSLAFECPLPALLYLPSESRLPVLAFLALRESHS